MCIRPLKPGRDQQVLSGEARAGARAPAAMVQALPSRASRIHARRSLEAPETALEAHLGAQLHRGGVGGGISIVRRKHADRPGFSSAKRRTPQGTLPSHPPRHPAVRTLTPNFGRILPKPRFNCGAAGKGCGSGEVRVRRGPRVGRQAGTGGSAPRSRAASLRVQRLQHQTTSPSCPGALRRMGAIRRRPPSRQPPDPRPPRSPHLWWEGAQEQGRVGALQRPVGAGGQRSTAGSRSRRSAGAGARGCCSRSGANPLGACPRAAADGCSPRERHSSAPVWWGAAGYGGGAA